jgi:hypothetical protein
MSTFPYRLDFAELHAGSEMSPDPAVFLARNGLRDGIGDGRAYIAAADVDAVLEAAKSNPVYDAGLTPFHWFYGEMADALKLWEERLDGINLEPVNEAIRRKLFVAARGVRQ